MSKRYKALRRARYYEAHPESEPFKCWCGVVNPYFSPIREGCGGMGYVNCICGGDFCVCHHHGEAECFGCEDCDQSDPDEDFYYEDEMDSVVSYETELAAWKRRNGLPEKPVNQDELLMVVEENQSKETSWCLGCDKEMSVREMKLITRSIDAYVQYDEGETDYIKKDCRVRMCPECFAREYEAPEL